MKVFRVIITLLTLCLIGWTVDAQSGNGWRIRQGTVDFYVGSAIAPATSGGATLGTAARPWGIIYSNGNTSVVGSGQSTPLLQFGGTTSGFPALQRITGALYCRLADDSAYCPLGASQYRIGTTILITSTAPTVSSGCGTSPVIVSNSTAAFRVTIGSGGTDTTCALTMPAAATGWSCHFENITGNAANRADRKLVQTAQTTTSATFQYEVGSLGTATAFTAADVIVASCLAF